MKVRFVILAISLTASFASGFAQQTRSDQQNYIDSVTDAFNRYRKEVKTEFEQFRHRLNREYAEMIGGKWENFKTERTKAPEKKPKPVKPPTAPSNARPVSKTVPVSKVVPPEEKIADIPVTLPKIDRTHRKAYPVNFTFYGTPCGIRRFDTTLLSLSGTDNASLKKSWNRLTADGNLDTLIEDCLRLREELQLCDWGFLKLVDKISQTLYPNSANAQAFMTDVLMTQAGYDCRLAIMNGQLGMAYNPSHEISGVYFTMEGKRYFHYGRLAQKDGTVSSYKGDFRKDPTPIRMAMDRYPQFAYATDNKRKYTSENWKNGPEIEVEVNYNAIQFFDDYPVVDWSIYGLSPLSTELRCTLIPAMQELTKGMGEVEAVNSILNYFNYGFAYMRDDLQFGREKPFFPDENFYYPFNDCEDRAILFAKVVKEVLPKLDVVYLHLPIHLATAVRFSPGVKITGTSVNVDGQPYYVCDPTCVPTVAGYLHPNYAGKPITVYKIEL